MFEDRRRTERRRLGNRRSIPASGERRRSDRRRNRRRYQQAPWWLQTNYAEELRGRDAAAELKKLEQGRLQRDAEPERKLKGEEEDN